MADHIGLLDISGSFMPRPTNVVDVSGNMNLRRSEERQLYTRLIKGEALKTDVGESKLTTDSNTQATEPSWTQARAGKHHGFVVPALSSSVDEAILNTYTSGSYPLESTAVPASASAQYGKRNIIKRSYVFTASLDPNWVSDYNNVSGSFMEYGYGNFAHQVLINVPDEGRLLNIRVWVELITRHDYVVAAASPDYYNNGNSLDDEHFFIPTSRSVQLSDIGLYLLPPVSPLNEFYGPRWAYPGWNDPNGLDALYRVTNDEGYTFDGVPPFYPSMQGNREFVVDADRGDLTSNRAQPWDGTYVLWEGKRCFLDIRDEAWGRNLSQSLPGPITIFVPGSSSLYSGYSANTGAYVNWDSDFNMRTVFCDDSTTPNPAHLDSLYDFSSSSFSRAPVTVLSGNSPNYNGLRIYSGAFYGQPLTSSAYGLQFPWFVDDRLPQGMLVSASVPISGWNMIGFPPDGWLTGGKYVVSESLLVDELGNLTQESHDRANYLIEVSGYTGGEKYNSASDKISYRWYAQSASAGEFPTRGRNLGPATIKPVMPLLDDIYTETLYRDPFSYNNPGPSVREGGTMGVRSSMNENVILRGFRPGLRGAQIRGNWILYIVMPTDYYNGAFRYGGYWLRQWRLELTFEQNEGVTHRTLQSRDRKYKKPASPTVGKKLIGVMSGCRVFPFHHGVEKYYVIGQEEYGQTYGIVSDTGSNKEFAVFTRVTGTLADRHSASLGFFSSFLTNEFGTPYVPISSGSGETPSIEILEDKQTTLEERRAVHETISPMTIVPQASTLKSTLSRTEYTKSTADRVISKISAVRFPTSGSS